MTNITQHEDPAEANEARALRASAAVDAYMGNDEEFYLHDLICDLGHWLRQYPHADWGEHTSLDAACQAGIESFETELSEEAHAAGGAATAPGADDA